MNRLATRLERSGAIVDNSAVLSAFVQRVPAVLQAATRPAPVAIGLLLDLTRSRDELVAENAMLHQQLIVAAPMPKVPSLGRGRLAPQTLHERPASRMAHLRF
jgi:hypothetical protein